MSTRPQSEADVSLEQGFRIGELRVDPVAGEISGASGIRKLDPKVMDVLLYMAKHAGHVVTREDLHAALWPNVVVTDDALTRCFYELRRHLSHAGGSDEFKTLIETLPKRGYRLSGEVTPLPAGEATRGTSSRTAAWTAAALVVVLLAIIGYRVYLSPPEPPKLAVATRYSIAVLPFVDMSERKDQGYFSDGTSEEILNRLAQSPDLRVIARTSSFTFRDQPLDVPTIAKRLKVTHVLEGSVRKSGDRVRVTAQLIAATDGAHVWSDTYDRTLGDVFAIQDDIASAVASALEAALSPGKSGPQPPANLKAYELLLQGEFFYWRRSPGDIERSIRCFEDAVKLDPGYARAWANLAGAYSMTAWSVDPPSKVLRAKQREAALRAVALDPTLGLAHRRLAQYYFESGNDREGRKHSKLARKFGPNEPLMIADDAQEAFDDGHYGRAIGQMKRAIALDPLAMVYRLNLGAMWLGMGRFESALATYSTVLEMNPNFGEDFEIEIPRLLLLLGRNEDAVAAAMRLSPGKYRDQALALFYAVPGQQDEADAALRRLEAYVPTPPVDTPEHTIMDSVRLAEIYAYRGRNNDAFKTLRLRRAELEQHTEKETYLWKFGQETRIAPFLRPLHADARWAALVADTT